MFDSLDTQTAQERESMLFAGFAERLARCMSQCSGLAAHLEGYPPGAVTDRAALQKLPVLRKNDLMAAQQKRPPFGGFVNDSDLQGTRIFMSPGPVWEPQLVGADPWQAARALHAAGITAGHRVHNAFSYHQTPGGFILDEGARAIGCIVFPAGVGGTAMQVNAMRHYKPQVYVGTPDYLQTLLDHAEQEGETLSCISRALVSGGALFPAMRERYAAQGIHVQQCYATADLGVIAYETSDGASIHRGMVVNEGLIVEILVPGTGIPVKPGEVGEVVVTRLSKEYPLVRLATGDLSAEMTEKSPCGRTQLRLMGWMGRADQRAKVRGMFVDPMQLEPLAKLIPGVERWRLEITRQNDQDAMMLKVTVSDDKMFTGEQKITIESQLGDTLQELTKLKGGALVVSELPNDGVIIDDQRQYQDPA